MDIYRFRLPGFERTFTRKSRNRGYLVILQAKKKSREAMDDSAQEMEELVRSVAVQKVGVVKAFIPHPSPSHFLREGKLREIREDVEKCNAEILIFNIDLSSTQANNIEAFTGIPVVDRTGLILEIFGRRAKSKEGKLQVELANLQYALPRLRGLGGVMSRLGGGIGTRGPGEQELEKDRRKVRHRIERVKEELRHVQKHRGLVRQGRKKKRFISIALVGYTNAGKSTLLNSLTGAKAVVEDKLFATLDPMTRLQSINGHRDLLFVDTVGFIRDLPHTLVESFQATLEEVAEADVLIHVLDVSHPRAEDFKIAVEKVLEQIDADQKTCVLALNKADLLNEEQKKFVSGLWPQGILVSAKERWGLEPLLDKVDQVAHGRVSRGLKTPE
ncbi:MAG: GTPase HflX [Candidatus Omnitrophica bacterium]|nr:GTPase HflX [Candidatus Omnitrophota bacterium]